MEQDIIIQEKKEFNLLNISTLMTTIIVVVYLIFGFTSKTTVPIIVAFLVAAAASGMILNFYKGFFADYIVIMKAAFVGIAMAKFCGNSIGDVTEFITGVGMYGDSSNVYFRAVILFLMIVNIVLLFVASRRNK